VALNPSAKNKSNRENSNLNDKNFLNNSSNEFIKKLVKEQKLKKQPKFITFFVETERLNKK
jgi:hypothetical protein